METGFVWPQVLLVFSAFLGGGLAFFFQSIDRRYLQLFLSFSGAFLFGITVLHLLPDVYQYKDYLTGVLILAGFLFQLVLEQFSRGAEHGHIDVPHIPKSNYFLGVFIGLSIHAFIEGVPLANTFSGYQVGTALLFGISMHKIPAAFALTCILFFSRANKLRIFISLVLFSLMTPIGMLSGNFFIKYMIINPVYIIALVIGSFLHISTTILFESGTEKHHFNILKIIAILAGIGISILV